MINGMVNDLDATLGALGDPTRRAIVELLRGGPRRPGELSARFGVSAPAISRHLRVLRACGLVEEERLGADARGRLYRLRPQPLAELRAWIERVEAFWSEQLEAFREHVESDGGEQR